MMTFMCLCWNRCTKHSNKFSASCVRLLFAVIFVSVADQDLKENKKLVMWLVKCSTWYQLLLRFEWFSSIYNYIFVFQRMWLNAILHCTCHMTKFASPVTPPPPAPPPPPTPLRTNFNNYGCFHIFYKTKLSYEEKITNNILT
jgi:hypothetical protein